MNTLLHLAEVPAGSYTDLTTQLSNFLGLLETWGAYAVFVSSAIAAAGVAIFWLTRAGRGKG